MTRRIRESTGVGVLSLKRLEEETEMVPHRLHREPFLPASLEFILKVSLCCSCVATILPVLLYLKQSNDLYSASIKVKADHPV